MDKQLRKARNQRYYAAHKEKWALYSSVARPTTKTLKPFIGVDGEGGGTDELGRQNFLLLRAGNDELFRNNARLTTEECLEFLLGLPRNAILVGYYFTYDATQILRDLPPERLTRLFEKKDNEPGISPYTFYGSYGIDFRPRQYLRVCRINRDTLRAIPSSARTVNEVGGFFQKSFVEAIKEWNVGDPKTVDMIARNKERRDTFDQITREERDYCAAECAMLSEMMDKLRDVCIDADIAPSQWRGAGWLSARLHAKHGTPKRETLKRVAPLEAMAIRSYYGGRFEITTVGKVNGTIYEYDLNSAYPAAMLELPCSLHANWKRFRGDAAPKGATFVAQVSFNHEASSMLGNLPIRRKGRLFWPREGEGYYWSFELNAAIEAGTIIKEWKGGYYAVCDCFCDAHKWVKELYTLRKSIGKSTRGYPLKLGLNGLYGKYAQREGAAPWRDYIAAGLITAYTRSKLIKAYTGRQNAILYLATDAVFSREKLDVECGSDLGQWEYKERDGLFIVQPGIYWSDDLTEKPKTRGIPRSRIIEARDQFEAVWQAWIANPSAELPHITVPVKSFIGHRMALAWGRPEAAGSWIILGNGGRKISFAWREKRDETAYAIDNGCVITMPRPGGELYISEPYDPKLLTEFDEQSLIDEAAADFIQWGNSGE